MQASKLIPFWSEVTLNVPEDVRGDLPAHLSAVRDRSDDYLYGPFASRWLMVYHFNQAPVLPALRWPRRELRHLQAAIQLRPRSFFTSKLSQGIRPNDVHVAHQSPNL